MADILRLIDAIVVDVYDEADDRSTVTIGRNRV